MNFTISELCASSTAKKNNIANIPQQLYIYDNMLNLIVHFLQPLRDKLQKPIIITSGYRCIKLNTLVGGVLNSGHTKGFCADIYVPNMNVEQLFNFIATSNLKWTQLIEEHSRGSKWVHVDFNIKNLKCEKLKYIDGKYIKIV